MQVKNTNQNVCLFLIKFPNCPLDGDQRLKLIQFLRKSEEMWNEWTEFAGIGHDGDERIGSAAVGALARLHHVTGRRRGRHHCKQQHGQQHLQQYLQQHSTMSPSRIKEI